MWALVGVVSPASISSPSVAATDVETQHNTPQHQQTFASVKTTLLRTISQSVPPSLVSITQHRQGNQSRTAHANSGRSKIGKRGPESRAMIEARKAPMG